MLRLMTMRTHVSGGALSGLGAGVCTLLLLLAVDAVAGRGQCSTDLVCRVDVNEPTGCAPAQPCDGPGPSLQTALVVELLVGLVVGVAAAVRHRSSQRG